MKGISNFFKIVMVFIAIAVSSANICADSVDLGPTVGTDITLDGVTYVLCRGTAYVTEVSPNKEHVVIPNKVEKNGKIYIVREIGPCAFSAWGKNVLKTVVLPNTLEKIGSFAFNDCKYLKSIEIPNSVTEIKCGAFQGCYSLESVTLSEGLRIIDEWLFNTCKSLKSVIIPLSIERIRDDAFSGCSNLEDVIILNPNAKIHEGAFAVCPKLKIHGWNGKMYKTKYGYVEEGNSRIYYNARKSDDD